jgi:endonuclease/exonuclease/phosphatase family metal-dependent hydrolase
MNEICIPVQTARWLQQAATRATGTRFALVQQSKTNGGSRIEGVGVMTRFPIIETANFDYQTLNYVALVARMEIEQRLLDVYVTHLYQSRGDESLRVFQVQQLLEWNDSRDDAYAQIVCGDFNAAPDKPVARRMASKFEPTQNAATAFTPLADEAGEVAHSYWQRMDCSIDYIWVRGPIRAGYAAACVSTCLMRRMKHCGHPITSACGLIWNGSSRSSARLRTPVKINYALGHR